MHLLTIAAEMFGAAPAPAEDTTTSQTLIMWSALVAWAMPPAIACINQSYWPSIVKLVTTLALSTGAAAGTAALQGEITPPRWVTSALVIATGAVLTYKTAWERIAKQIETATDLRAGRPAAG